MRIVIRWLPGALWWQIIATWRWELPNRSVTTMGLVDRWAAGPFIVLRLPDTKATP